MAAKKTLKMTEFNKIFIEIFFLFGQVWNSKNEALKIYKDLKNNIGICIKK